ncbi:PREDICTED: dnaJ homolog subfamily C member 1-like [Amphimedon queenslandica]|uniref:DnaJ homolog subfamily C member 1 n=1 Tax=Amphimedon queenslandica TaxID=400682 RepID=A0A1X7VV24_AMPQE|nr:PREDICTED: dnaJ homolog subfamily C member 1-like [Amphimedon queenslandica]|eukprot:XP_003382630.1 PREDICTED: dnaJ homolog subfamily C member 1-like [Amphimedon queenslandica]
MATLTTVPLLLLVLFLCPSFTLAWSQVELDLFDLVEEVNENFYDFLQITQDASAAEIRRSYRKLSLQYHPDKNRDDPNAAETFRKIGAVADILRNEETREMYNEVLLNGLPDWRQPVYYYRRVRKMSLIELSGLLLVVIIVGQLLYGWAQYAEKQLVLYDLRQKKEKKDRKLKGRKGPQQISQLDAEVLYHEALAKAALPHYSKLLPCVLVKKTLQYSFVLICILWSLTKSRKQQESKGGEEREEEQRIPSNKYSARSKRRHIKEKEEKEEEVDEGRTEERPDIKSDEDTSVGVSNGDIEDSADTPMSEEEKKRIEEEEEEKRRQEEEKEKRRAALLKEKERELEEELVQLEESIMEDEKSKRSKRSNKKAHSSKVKSPLADKSLEYQQEWKEEKEIATESKSVDPKGIAMDDGVDSQPWSQEQQKELENALKQYNKEESNRWELIASCVTGKTKDECIERYKELVELIRKKKSQ